MIKLVQLIDHLLHTVFSWESPDTADIDKCRHLLIEI